MRIALNGDHMSAHPNHRIEPWSILIYRVSSLERQQRILQAFHDFDRPGVLALGTGAAGDPHVVVETPSLTAENFSKRVIQKLDPAASSASGSRVSAPSTVASLLLTFGGRRPGEPVPDDLDA